MNVNGFELTYQIMMGLSLAACAGFRAWLPMLALGIMARSGYVTLGSSFNFLASDSVLIIFGVATVLEVLGDKIIAVDHFLDAVGTVARPAAGTMLASAMFTSMDPSTALILGLVIGGTTSLTVHAGKALARAKVSILSPFHGGTGNAAVSFVEDGMASVGIALALVAPVIAFFLALTVLGMAGIMIYFGITAGQKIFKFLFNRQRYIDTSRPLTTSPRTLVA